MARCCSIQGFSLWYDKKKDNKNKDNKDNDHEDEDHEDEECAEDKEDEEYGEEDIEDFPDYNGTDGSKIGSFGVNVNYVPHHSRKRHNQWVALFKDEKTLEQCGIIWHVIVYVNIKRVISSILHGVYREEKCFQAYKASDILFGFYDAFRNVRFPNDDKSDLSSEEFRSKFFGVFHHLPSEEDIKIDVCKHLWDDWHTRANQLHSSNCLAEGSTYYEKYYNIRTNCKSMKEVHQMIQTIMDALWECDEELILAVCMGLHSRLGAKSVLRYLDIQIVQSIIWPYVRQANEKKRAILRV